MAFSHFKKAVQPDHPSAKACGQAASQPPCERGVPIYPLRYGITEPSYDIAKIAESNPASFGRLQVKDYPALQGGKAYGLRVLRPDSYVYLFYFQEGRMKTRHYQVTEDIRFAHLWWTEADYNDAAPGRLARPDTGRATPYLLAPETSVADTVYLMVSDTILTHATLWKIEQDTDGLRSSLTTEVKPAAPVKPQLALPHTFSSLMLGSLTKELVPSGLGPFTRYYDWSEIRLCDKTADYLRILNAMKLAQLPTSQGQVWAVALQDPLGMISELNHLCAAEVAKRDRYQADSKHRLQSAALIKGYFQQAQRHAKQPQEQEALARQRELVNFQGVQGFQALYEKKLASFSQAITQTGADVTAWIHLMPPGAQLGKALSLFDLACANNARDYEVAVLNCLATASHTEAGLQALTRQIEASPAISPLWKALAAGDVLLMDRLNNPVTISKGVFDVVDKLLDERPATQITELLAMQLWNYIAKAPVQQVDPLMKRLRHLSERRYGKTIGFIDVSMEQYQRWSLELQGYVSSGEIGKRWKSHMNNIRGPSQSTSLIEASRRVAVWDWESIATMAIQKPELITLGENPLLRRFNQARQIGGAGFTGIGGALAIWGIRNALKDLRNEENFNNYLAFFGALTAIVGASIEASSLTIAYMSSRQGNKALAKIATRFGVKWGATVAGAGASGFMAAADLMRSIDAKNDANFEQSRMYLYSAISGGVSAYAIAAGGAAALARMGMASASIWVLGANPWAWAAIVVIATGSAIYCSLKAAEAQHGPMEILLKHSAWGIHQKKYVLVEELTAWHSLQYSPQLSAKWESAQGAAGTLRLLFYTPPANRDTDDIYTEIKVKLKDKELGRLKSLDVLKQTNTSINLDENYIVEELTDSLGKKYGWSIAMHKDAKVEFEYTYWPDICGNPALAIEQAGAPEPLVFTASGWVQDTIAVDKLMPIRPPK